MNSINYLLIWCRRRCNDPCENIACSCFEFEWSSRVFVISKRSELKWKIHLRSRNWWSMEINQTIIGLLFNKLACLMFNLHILFVHFRFDSYSVRIFSKLKWQYTYGVDSICLGALILWTKFRSKRFCWIQLWISIDFLKRSHRNKMLANRDIFLG